MEPRWLRGIWLGKRFGTEEHVLSTIERTVGRGSAVRVNLEKQWDIELSNSFRGLPWDPSRTNTVDVKFCDLPKVVLGEPERAVPIPLVRRVPITGAKIV